MEHFGYACPRSIFFIYLYGSKEESVTAPGTGITEPGFAPTFTRSHPPTHTHFAALLSSFDSFGSSDH